MQIFDRISRIFRANYSNNTSYGKSLFESEDDELKRIIDELNSDKSDGKETKSENSQNEYSHKNDTELEKAFRILGLNINSDNQQIKNVYRNKMKEYHPDKFSKQSNEIREKAEKRSMEINEAYTKIRKARGF